MFGHLKNIEENSGKSENSIEFFKALLGTSYAA